MGHFKSKALANLAGAFDLKVLKALIFHPCLEVGLLDSLMWSDDYLIDNPYHAHNSVV